MIFAKGVPESTYQDKRIEFAVLHGMFDLERIGSLTDSYTTLDAVLRQDMLYHYAGSISALYWIALCQYPQYGHLQLVDTVDRNFPQIARALRADEARLTPLDLVSLGPGDGEIDIRILRHLEKNFDVRFYYCLDFSFELLRHAVFRVSTAKILKNGFGIKATWGNFLESGNLIAGDEGVRLFALTGFTLGNYNEAELLGKISRQMTQHDFLLVDAHLHNLKHWDGHRPVSKADLLPLLRNYSQDTTHRFVFGPVEVATMATVADVTFDYMINREMTSVPKALNTTIFCRDLRTRMRFSGEPVNRKRLNLACTTFYDCANLKKWFPTVGFRCIWEHQENCIALFLLKRVMD